MAEPVWESYTPKPHGPDDPLCHVCDCVSDYDGCEGSISTDHRASATAFYAGEQGVSFQQVRCLRIYVHVYTYQEAWDSYGWERAVEDAMDKSGAGWYFDTAGYGPEGYYMDDEPHEPFDADALERSIPKEVPPTWEPNDGDPFWERVDRNHSRAIPAWECELA